MKTAATRALTLALLCIATPATASQALTFSTPPQNDSPIQIDECAGGIKDSEHTSDYYFGANCTIHVIDPKRTAKTIRFRFRFLDAFGDRAGSFHTDIDGTFAAGQPIKLWPTWTERITRWPNVAGSYFTVINTYTGARSVIISVSRVLFDDGSTWTADPANELNDHALKRVSAPALPAPTVPANYVTPEPNMTPTPQ